MRTAMIRRLLYLATAVLALWAVILVPAFVLPKQTARILEKLPLPSRVKQRLRKLTAPGESVDRIDPDAVDKALTPPKGATTNQGTTQERYQPIEWAITGERPVAAAPSGNDLPSGPLDGMVKVLITLAHPDVVKTGGFAVLDVTAGPRPGIVAVGEGDEVRGIGAKVKSVLKDTVIFEYRNKEERLYRDGLERKERLQLEQARKKARDQGRAGAAAPSSAAAAKPVSQAGRRSTAAADPAGAQSGPASSAGRASAVAESGAGAASSSSRF